PDPRGHPFGSGHQPGIRPVIHGGSGRRCHTALVSCRFSTRRPSLLGSSCPRHGVVPSSRSAYHQPTLADLTGLPRSTRARCGRGGCPLYPGTAVLSRPALNHRPPPAASQRPVLHPLPYNPSEGAQPNGTSTRIHLRSPVRPF